MNKNETIIFVHIPKTAGSTFSSILRRLYPIRRHEISGIAQAEEFPQIPLAERSQLDLLLGHFAYGIHIYIPRPSQYITFLREPVERVISTYYFILRSPGHYLHRRVVEGNVSLAEFINSSLSSRICNLQTRMIAGIEQVLLQEPPALDEVSLSLAKARLNTDFIAFGLTEKFDESLILICHALGWPLLNGKFFYTRENVTDKRKSRVEIPLEVIDAIIQKNALDIELYRYASALFEKRIEGVHNFHLSLTTFRLLNPLAQKYRNFQRSRRQARNGEKKN